MAVEERERLDDDLERIARADLKALGDIRIDDVLSFIDRGIERMPSYMDLYRRWKKTVCRASSTNWVERKISISGDGAAHTKGASVEVTRSSPLKKRR